jgi:hypothetical protein
MSDTPRRVFVGTYPAGSAIFIDGDDPARHMIAEAAARLDRMREDDQRARQAALAEEATTKPNTTEEPNRPVMRWRLGGLASGWF